MSSINLHENGCNFLIKLLEAECGILAQVWLIYVSKLCMPDKAQNRPITQ